MLGGGCGTWVSTNVPQKNKVEKTNFMYLERYDIVLINTSAFDVLYQNNLKSDSISVSNPISFVGIDVYIK